MSRRTQRLSSLIRRILADAIQTRLSDPRIAPFTSITRVEVAADLTIATVYVSVMAQRETAGRLTVEALESAAGRLRSRLADELTVRRVPELRFRYDESLQGAFETVRVIESLVGEHAPAAEGAGSETDEQPDGREDE